MKLKNSLALVLIIALLATMFVACGKKEDKTEVSDNPSVSSDVSNDPVVDPNEITEINFWMYDMGTQGTNTGVGAVLDAINAITEKEIGVRVNMTWVSFADYGTQLTLSIANKEAIDLATYNPRASFLSLYSAGMMMDITDLLDNEGSEIRALLGEEILNTTSVGGRVYGLSNYRLLNSNFYIIYRTDVLEDVGMLDTYKNMTTWSEYESILKAVTENANMYGTGNQTNVMPTGYLVGGDSFSDSITWDSLGDSLYFVYSDQNGNVDLLFNNEAAADTYKLVADWLKKGYVYPDSAFSQENGDTMISQRVMGGCLVTSEMGVEAAKRDACGTDMSCYQVASNYITTTNGRAWGTFIPSSAAEPEAAIKFLSLLYTNADLMNLFIWGIEGENYVINENGEASYKEGENASSSGYHGNDWTIGNQFLLLPWNGAGTNFRDLAHDDFTAAPKSVYMGLAVDTSDYASLVSSLSAVKDEYLSQFTCGMYTDSLYSEFLSKLESAGVDDYIALYQNAVSEFVG